MWHIRAALIAMAGSYVFLVPGVRADSLQLKNGDFVQGKYLGGTERAVQFQVNGKVRLYDVEGILSISFAASSADGGIPSNNIDPKPGDSTASNSEARSHGVLRIARWKKPGDAGSAAAAIARQNKERSNGIDLPGERPAEQPQSSYAVLTASSKAKARIAAARRPAVRPQREPLPVFSD